MVQPSAPPRAPIDALQRAAIVRYPVAEFSDSWLIPEEPVPESAWHDRCLEVFRGLLDAWVSSTGRNAAVFRDIAIQARREKPRVGWNPDVCLVEPAPAGAQELESMRLWEHAAPLLAFEAVSPNHPFKDYAIIPEKCAIAGVGELCVFDPLLAGPRAQGGPWLVQLWRRAPDRGFERVYAGDDAVESAVLGAFLVPDRASRTLRIAGRATGEEPWLTPAEQARRDEALAREAEAHAREAEARAREAAAEAHARETAALERIAELEKELRRRG
jgi:hypothetical protein